MMDETIKTVLNYPEVCMLAHRMGWDVDIKPDVGAVSVSKMSVKVGDFVEIGSCIFVFVKDESYSLPVTFEGSFDGGSS